MPNPDFLQLLACADVLLDPFPFCGGNSSYEAFSVGTPVVTLPGRFLRGRLTYAMLQRMGITSLHASSVSDYVRIAVELGCDPSKNQACRKQISESAGVLFDNPDDVSVWESLFQSWIG
jgi:predicted O-linked N-acetylglucosamine transferase (SPINDLY family)